jgi:hypothetical protein
VTKDGAKGQVYSAERDMEDGRAFLERGRDDRHQFRFIVSSEGGAIRSAHHHARPDAADGSVKMCGNVDKRCKTAARE